jgi:hypothetical protein
MWWFLAYLVIGLLLASSMRARIPRQETVKNIRIQTSSYGVPIFLVYGKARVAGNLLWYADFYNSADGNPEAFGKGGGGDAPPEVKYFASLLLGLCEGPIIGIGKTWASKKSYPSLSAMGFSSSLGSTTQQPWSHLTTWHSAQGAFQMVETIHTLASPYQYTVGHAAEFRANVQVVKNIYGMVTILTKVASAPAAGQYSVTAGGVYTFNAADAVYVLGKAIQITYRWGGSAINQALAYRNTAIVFGTDIALDYTSTPNYSFEVAGFLPYNSGVIDDCNPSAVITDLLTNARYGAGWSAGKLADLTSFSDYCIADGMFFSPVLSGSKPIHEVITELTLSANSAVVWSEGKLKITPFMDQAVTGNGKTFTPNVTPEYDLTDDHFQPAEGEDPIICTRLANVDAYNHVRVEFVNRDREYNPEIAEAKDQASIEKFGLRSQPLLTLHHITMVDVARRVAQLILQRNVYALNQYQFKLDLRFSRLEAMDIVTLTDVILGFDKKPVRVMSVEEDEQDVMTLIAEDFNQGAGHAAQYPSQLPSSFDPAYNVDPGNVFAPYFYEPTHELAASLEVLVAVAGGPDWGGCQVWASTDDQTYKVLGTITTISRYGLTTATVPATSTDPDTASVVSVDISATGQQLIAISQSDFDAYNSLFVVDNELMVYRDAALAGTGLYDLQMLHRGLYASKNVSHGVGAKFIRLDGKQFIYPYTEDRIGSTIYLKFASFNKFGGGRQDVAALTAYPYVITGIGYAYDVPDVTGLVSYFQAGFTFLRWNAVTDARPVSYEIRKGPVFATAQVLGVTPLTIWQANGDDTYWATGVTSLARSATPASVDISGSALVANVVATWDEKALGWPGTLSGSAVIEPLSGNLVLGGTGSFSSIPVFSTEPTIMFYGGAANSGEYTIPVSHEVDLGTAQICTVNAGYVVEGRLAIGLVPGNYGANISATIQLSLAQNDGIYGAWENFVAGQYVARKFKFRVLLTSNDVTITPMLSEFNFSVDMPDRVERLTDLAVAVGGTAYAYSTPFQIVPNVQVTILDTVEGDDVFFLAGPTAAGGTIQIKNGGTGVARAVNILSQGY